MKNVLVVNSSPNIAYSKTRKVSKLLENRIKELFPSARFTERDLVVSNIPHIDSETLEIMLSKNENSDHPFNIRSMQFINELQKADMLVIGVPMYNFSVPSNLKAWIDHIARAGLTFSYSSNGPIGLLKNLRAIIITSADGTYSSGEMKEWNFLEPYLIKVLNFIGVEDIQVVRLEGRASSNKKESFENEIHNQINKLTL